MSPRAVGRALFLALRALGAFWMCLPPVLPPAGPGPGHPERLVPHIPADERERLLWRQINGDG